MTRARLPEASTLSDRKVIEDVQQHGWHVVKILEEEDVPGWAYTIGLHHSYGHPELILFGLPLDTAHALLNVAGEAIAGGRSFAPNTPLDDFVEGHDFVLRDVAPRWYRAFVGYAVWFHQQADFPLMQLFWPDREGVLPWHPAASAWLQASQPLLFEDTVARARVEPLLHTDDAER